MHNSSIVAVLFLALCPPVLSQDGVLFTIDGEPTTLAEFRWVYDKNKNIPGYAETSLEEYLQMFINFKLKVHEARMLGYDTVPAFVSELAGYRSQLAKPYLRDGQVTSRLIQDAYYRTIHEVNASHIMVLLPEEAGSSDTLEAYRKIMAVRDRILDGADFGQAALEFSEDPSVNANRGDLGWFSAFTMVFPFEEAAYQTPVGQISMPVRTSYGYHIIKVNAQRKALGEIKLRHLMIRVTGAPDDTSSLAAGNRIQSFYRMLLDGYDFETLASDSSEDASTSGSGGEMRWIRSGELPPDIETAVFSLTDSGSFTPPLRSDYGWHIFQLIGKRDFGTFEEMEASLREKVLGDERIRRSEQACLRRICEETGCTVYDNNLKSMALLLDSSIYSGRWVPVYTREMTDPVIRIAGTDYTQKDLAAYLSSAGSYSRNQSFYDIVSSACDDMLNALLLRYEDNRLEDKYPEFRNLMREYHDGILLFNLSQDKIWNRASEDSTGLSTYFSLHRGDYMWQERADVSIYSLQDPSLASKVVRMSRKRVSRNQSPQEFINAVCGEEALPCITVKDLRVEKGQDQLADQIKFKKGAKFVTGDQEGRQIIVVNEVWPPACKTFMEARGQVIADYQDNLDKQWIEELRNAHTVVTYPETLDKLKNEYRP